jgi:hypothetical protein
VIVQSSPRTAEVRQLTLTVTTPAEAGVWRLVAPTRAADRPLAAGPWSLAPGARLDFDVRFAPISEHASNAMLELVLPRGHDLEVRRIMLTGRVARGPPSP